MAPEPCASPYDVLAPIGTNPIARWTLFFNDHPDRMDDSRDITQQGQEDIDPEVQPDPHLQKNTQGRQHDGQQNTNDIHLLFPFR